MGNGRRPPLGNTHALRPIGRQGGQGLVELALVLPIMLLLFVGVIDLGRVLYSKLSVTAAAEAGVLYASQTKTNAQDTAGITARVLAESSVSVGNTPTVTVTLSPVNGDGWGMQQVGVTVSQTVTTLFHWVGMPAAYTVQAQVWARILSPTPS